MPRSCSVGAVADAVGREVRLPAAVDEVRLEREQRLLAGHLVGDDGDLRRTPPARRPAPGRPRTPCRSCTSCRPSASSISVAVDLMVTTFVGGASTVTVVPQLSSVTGAKVALAVGVASRPPACSGRSRRRGRTRPRRRRRAIRVLCMGMRGSGGLRARGGGSLARGVGCTSHLRRAAHGRAARPDHIRSGSAHRVGLLDASAQVVRRAGAGAAAPVERARAVGAAAASARARATSSTSAPRRPTVTRTWSPVVDGVVGAERRRRTGCPGRRGCRRPRAGPGRCARRGPGARG